MTNQKVIESFKTLESRILEFAKNSKFNLVPTRFDSSDGKDLAMMLSQEKQLSHLLFMTQSGQDLVKSNRITKANRWLGWIQASLWHLNIYTLEQLKDVNRPAESNYSSERL